jgi:hypothetical protein
MKKVFAAVPYFIDANKYNLYAKNPITDYHKDKRYSQSVYVTNTVFGVTIRPAKQWTPFCERVFTKYNATSIRLEDISFAPNRSLDFIARLPGCRRLWIEAGENVDLSPLANNESLEELAIFPSVSVSCFDLTSLKNLRRCTLPVLPELKSFLNCERLISLHLSGGRYSEKLNLKSLTSLEELFCEGVKNLKEITLNPKVRLRSMKLLSSRTFERVVPQNCLTEELRVVELNKVPNVDIHWLAEAGKVECVSLRLGEVPSVNFLKKLKHLQVLDLFGSKIKDGDVSILKSLKGELDSKLWGTGEECP